MGNGGGDLKLFEQIMLFLNGQILINLLPKQVGAFAHNIKIMGNILKPSALDIRLQNLQIDLIHPLFHSKPQLVIANIIQTQTHAQQENVVDGPSVLCQ